MLPNPDGDHSLVGFSGPSKSHLQSSSTTTNVDPVHSANFAATKRSLKTEIDVFDQRGFPYRKFRKMASVLSQYERPRTPYARILVIHLGQPGAQHIHRESRVDSPPQPVAAGSPARCTPVVEQQVARRPGIAVDRGEWRVLAVRSFPCLRLNWPNGSVMAEC
jgi:hypothetical protein